LKPETVFWKEVKKKITGITFTRLESWASQGVPDLLCYNEKGTFFTVELKVTKTEQLRFFPHQISFHLTHPKNSFILAKSLGPCSVKLYEGSRILELKEKGLKLDACCLGLEACGLYFKNL